MFICNRSLEDSDRSDIDIKFFFWKVIQYQMQFVINSKVQVIVVGSTAVIGLVFTIKSASTEMFDWNGKLRHFNKCLSKLSVIEMEISDISRMFQSCSVKETTNPEYIEKYFTISRMDFVTWFLLDTITLMRLI